MNFIVDLNVRSGSMRLQEAIDTVLDEDPGQAVSEYHEGYKSLQRGSLNYLTRKVLKLCDNGHSAPEVRGKIKEKLDE